MTAGAVSYAQPSVTKVGGITEYLKVVALADEMGVKLAPHSPYFGPGFSGDPQLMSLRDYDTFVEVFYMNRAACLWGRYRRRCQWHHRGAGRPWAGLRTQDDLTLPRGMTRFAGAKQLYFLLRIFRAGRCGGSTRKSARKSGTESIEWPIGDIEAAHKIREICRSRARQCLRGLRASPAARTTRSTNTRPSASSWSAKAAMEIAMKISDDLMRDSAVRQIVDLCMKANDVRTARILFRAIQAPSLTSDVLNDHPTLRQRGPGCGFPFSTAG